MFQGCRTFIAADSIVFAAETHTVIPIQVATYSCYSHVYCPLHLACFHSLETLCNKLGTLALWNPLIYCSHQRAKCQNAAIIALFRCAAPPKAGQAKRISWSCRLSNSRFAEQMARQNLQLGKWLQLVTADSQLVTREVILFGEYRKQYRFRVKQTFL